MFKRARWFTVGATAGVASVVYVKRLADRARPTRVVAGAGKAVVARAQRAGDAVVDAVRDGVEAARAREAELKALRDGRVHQRAAARRPVIDVADVVELIPRDQLERAVRPGARAVARRKALGR